jgi:hypothetical protein
MRRRQNFRKIHAVHLLRYDMSVNPDDRGAKIIKLYFDRDEETAYGRTCEA